LVDPEYHPAHRNQAAVRIREAASIQAPAYPSLAQLQELVELVELVAAAALAERTDRIQEVDRS
jgi:hypothetical protein